MNIRSKKGFTLVEIMIVVVIIGLLAAMAIPAFQQVRRNSIGKTMANDARQIGAAAAQIAIDYPRVTTQGAVLAITILPDGGLTSAALGVVADGGVPVNEVTKYVKKISRGTGGTAPGAITYTYGLTVDPAAPQPAFQLVNPQASPSDVVKGSTWPANIITTVGQPCFFDEEGKAM